jgi:hypothetical protein
MRAIIAFLVPTLLVLPWVAWAQADPRAGPPPRPIEQDLPSTGRQVSPRGKTLPNVGEPQFGPETELERRLRERDEQMSRRICRGC